MKNKYFLLVITFLLTVCVAKSQTYAKYLKKTKAYPSKYLLKLPVGRPKGYFIVNVKFEGIAGYKKFMLDSGSGLSLISPELASEIKAKVLLTDTISDGFTTVKTPMGFIDIPIGNVTYKNVWVSIDSSVTKLKTAKIDGIIGANLMRESVWHFRNDSLYISNDTKFIDIKDYECEKLDFEYSPMVKFGIYRNLESFALFDLGYGGFISLVKNGSVHSIRNIRMKKKLSADGLNYTMLFTQNTKRDSMMMFKPKSNFIFGKKEIEDLIIETHNDGIDNNIIGNEILDYYDIILDLPKKKIYTKQIKNKYENSDYYSFGFGYSIVDNSVLVKFVWDDSPAYKSHIKTGMQVLKINDINLDNLNAEQINDVVPKLNRILYTGDTIVLKIKELSSEINLSIEPLMKITN